DEARTPLIISGRLADAAKVYYQFASLVRGLVRDDHYDVDEEKRTVAPTEEGIHAVERALGIENLYDSVSANLVHQFQVALKAKELFHRDKDYLVAKGEVKIVDEFTGRILEGRRWSDGLHQAVEAKEGVKIKEENQTLATITLQNYFRLYEKLAGMTGTAETEAAEFFNTYGLHVVPIPTNKPLIRDDEVDLIYRSEQSKFEAVVDDIVERHARGQPVLAGTISVEKSEVLSTLLNRQGIDHSVLNAKIHSSEGDIVAQAGRLGSVTVATNMAGRGVDIILGGNPEGLAERDLAAEGLVATDEEGAARLAELVAKYQPECKGEGDKVRALGGLYVVATERHDSRRIDNQLRGRSGRQGDPGASRFYLSLEDELMRLFATGAMDWVMQKALPDDIAIDSKMVTKAIERAQNTVEQRNAEIRKNVLKYDEVMNEQRRVIYRRREQILEGADLRDEALEYLAEAVDSTIATHCVSDYEEEWDLEGLATDTNTLWPNEVSIDDLSGFGTTDDIYEFVMSLGVAYYEDREAEIGPEIMRQIERQVMLRIIDQRWREHLYEMDYLKEGIHLRAMGQKDPLTEWQREGFEMFGVMMSSIAQDFVRYVTHIQVNTETEGSEPAGDASAAATDIKLSGPDDQGGGAKDMAAAANAAPSGR
ncbi:MAG: preprotein translocase subunit SecA, partial [Acidimicrobiales bacterium]